MLKFQIEEYLQKAEQNLKSTKKNWLDGDKFDSETEWLESISKIEGKIEAYKNCLYWIEQCNVD